MAYGTTTSGFRPRSPLGAAPPTAGLPGLGRGESLRNALVQTMGLTGRNMPRLPMQIDADERMAASGRNDAMIAGLTNNPDGRYWQGAQIRDVGGRNQFVAPDRPLGTATIPGGFAQWQAQQSGGMASLLGVSGPSAAGPGQPSATPPMAGLPAPQLAANRANYLTKRQAKKDQIAENRRLKAGLLTMAEIQQLGVPGLAVAQEQGQVAAGLQQNQLAAQGKQQKNMIRAGMKMQSAVLAQQAALASGNQQAAAAAQKMMIEAQKELTGMQTQSAEKVAGIGAEAEKAKSAPAMRQVEIQGEQLKMQQANQYRESARAKYAAGDIAGAQQDEAMANNMLQPPAGLPGVGQPAAAAPQAGLPQAGLPQGGAQAAASPRWGALPIQARQAIMGAGPEEMIANLRKFMPDLPQAEADAMLKAAYPGTTVSQYNPSGWGLSDIIGSFGMENYNRFGRWASGEGPQAPSQLGLPFGAPNPVLPGVPGMVQTAWGY